jgi:hypothetical protein
MKPTHSPTVFVAALVLGAVTVSGCAQVDAMEDQSQPEATASQTLAAGEHAQSRFGVESYEVGLSPNEDGNHVVVDLKGEGGTHLGTLSTYRDASGGTVLRITKPGSITELYRDAESMTVIRDGVVRYSLDLASANASGTLAELEASATPMPEELVAEVGLAATVATDGVLMDYVASVSPGAVPYYIQDCPWWVTGLSCISWSTGAGAVMCVACGLSYLL